MCIYRLVTCKMSFESNLTINSTNDSAIVPYSAKRAVDCTLQYPTDFYF